MTRQSEGEPAELECDRCGVGVGLEHGTLSWRTVGRMASRLTVRCGFDCDPHECDASAQLSWLGDRRLLADLRRTVEWSDEQRERLDVVAEAVRVLKRRGKRVRYRVGRRPVARTPLTDPPG